MLSRPYLDLLANPTPWSARMRPSFRHFLRLPCETLASASDGIGGALTTFRLTGGEPPSLQQWEELCTELERLGGVVGAHAGQRDAALPGPPGVSAAGVPDEVPTFVLLVEAQEPRALAMHGDAIRDGIARKLPTLQVRARGDYTLMHVLTAGRRPEAREG